jgi:large subunit ribosomal protein L31
MKTDIHPNYQEITTTCSCGNVLPVMSTLKDNLSLDVCAKCHPFYTGKQKMLDSGGRVKKFQDRFGASGASKPAAKKPEAKVEETAVEEVTEEVVETPVEEIIEETAAEVVEVEEAVDDAAEEEVSEDNAELETTVESDSESEEDK